MNVSLSQIYDVLRKLDYYKSDELDSILEKVKSYEKKCSYVSDKAMIVLGKIKDKRGHVLYDLKRDEDELSEVREKLKKTPTQMWIKREIKQSDGKIVQSTYAVPINESLISDYDKKIEELTEKIKKENDVYTGLNDKEQEISQIWLKYSKLSSEARSCISSVYDVEKKLAEKISEIRSQIMGVCGIVEEIENYRFTVSFFDSGVIKPIR